MSIYPNDRPEGLMYKWQTAMIDLPVPSSLTANNRDAQEWLDYLNCLSPAQQLVKLAQALDEFHDLLGDAATLSQRPRGEQAVIYSKWVAAQLVGGVLAKRLDFFPPNPEKKELFQSDLDNSLFLVTDFLRSVRSPDLAAWEARRARHNAIPEKPFSDFLRQSWEFVRQAPDAPAP